jgi:4-hydroxy-tetrahydrodipicolinate synthase
LAGAPFLIVSASLADSRANLIEIIKMTAALAGLWPPVATPFGSEGTVDTSRLVRHGRTLLADGADGLAVLGTTSEANSLTLDERRRSIDAFAEAGVDPGRLLPGTGACAIGDAVALTRHAGEVGAAGVLLLPPFYYKKVSDDGIFAFVAAVIERVGANVPRIMLYHIPPMASIGWSVDLVGRLVEAFPGIIAGMKDSSGDPEHTRKMIEAFPALAIFPGAEVYLVKALGWGARGCISASANINGRGIRRLIDRWRETDADRLQAEVNAVRKAAEAHVMIPSLKAMLAERYRDPAWLNVRPPLMRISETARAELLADPAIAALLGDTVAA